MTARPSITRQAPAKKRNRSELVAISSMAAPIGLPVWLDSSRPSSSAFASMMSAILSSARLRVWGVVRLQVSKAASAASTARSTSSWPEAGTCATTSSVAGFSTASVSPDAESTHWPPMNCWYVLTGFRVSVTRASKGRTSWRYWPRSRMRPQIVRQPPPLFQRRPSRATVVLLRDARRRNDPLREAPRRVLGRGRGDQLPGFACCARWTRSARSSDRRGDHGPPRGSAVMASIGPAPR